jgi:predicted TIM-barrel fold metal-dependent hydrolase
MGNATTTLTDAGFDMFDHDWTEKKIRPLVLDVIDIFGSSRCLFASNFPVSSLYGSYENLVQAYSNILAEFSDDERDGIFFSNAARYYRI